MHVVAAQDAYYYPGMGPAQVELFVGDSATVIQEIQDWLASTRIHPKHTDVAADRTEEGGWQILVMIWY